MSKMRVAEMSVVRFTESDVIVASQIVVSGADDKAGHNLTVTRYGTEIFSNNQQSGFNHMSQYGYTDNPLFYWSSAQGTSPYDLNALIQSDNNGEDYEAVDGVYIWDGAVFTKKYQ